MPDLFAGAPLSAVMAKTTIPVRNLWYLLLYAWDLARFKGRWPAEEEHAPKLRALFASILAQLITQRIRIGLGRGYVLRQGEARRLRGRIDFDATLKRTDYVRGAIHCRYQELSIDVPRNQIVRATLAWLAKIGQFGLASDREATLRSRLRQLARTMEGVSLVDVTPAMFRTQQLGRNDSDYALMLRICDLLWRQSMPTQFVGPATQSALDVAALSLPKIFEKFVANFYRMHLDGWDVTAQSVLQWPSGQPHPNLPVMRPDLVLRQRSSGTMVVLDTKYTAASLVQSAWGNEVFDSGHLYQLYTYLRSQEDKSKDHRSAEGILLYPSIGTRIDATLTIQGHTVRIGTVDLAQPWKRIEDELIGLVVISTRDGG